MLLQQATEVKDGGLVQHVLHRRIAVAEPVLQQMHKPYDHQRIGRTGAFILGVVRLNQSDQALPRHHLIHLDQEQLLAGLLALAGVLGVGEGHLLHRETRATGAAYFIRNGKSSSGFP